MAVKKGKVICRYCAKKVAYSNLGKHHKTKSCIAKRKEEIVVGRPKKKKNKKKKNETEENNSRIELSELELGELEVFQLAESAQLEVLEGPIAMTRCDEVRPRKDVRPKPVPSDKSRRCEFSYF